MQKIFLPLAGLICTILPISAHSQEDSGRTFCYYAGKQYSEGAWLCVGKLRAVACLHNGSWDTIFPNDAKNNNLLQTNPEVCSGPTSNP
jgi:hypothetical protein